MLRNPARRLIPNSKPLLFPQITPHRGQVGEDDPSQQLMTLPLTTSNVFGNRVSATPHSSHWQKLHWSPWVLGQVSLSWESSKMFTGLQIPRCPQPKGKCSLTSLLRQAFRCRGLLDMKNCQVVSAQGWGPGFSGAYCTLRISRRAEFLGSSRGQQDNVTDDTQCLAETGALHSHVLTPEKSLTRGCKAEQTTKVHQWTIHPF